MNIACARAPSSSDGQTGSNIKKEARESRGAWLNLCWMSKAEVFTHEYEETTDLVWLTGTDWHMADIAHVKHEWVQH